MEMRTIGTSLAARAAALLLTGTFIAGCSSSAHLLPALPASAPGISLDSVPVIVQIRIPRHSRHRRGPRPATISSLTHSISVAVNAAKAQVFNTTTTSPDCTATSAGTSCTFAVAAPAGTDTFTVTTYSGINATGTALDRGIALLVPIAKGKANHVSIRLGPLVTTTADTGTGSLRYAVQTASNGDTISFSLPKPSTITLASPIVVGGTLTIAGPGAANVIVSGAGTHQLFKIQGNVTISGLTLERGKAATAGQPGGAIFNVGALTLASDTIGSNASTVALRRVPVKFRSLRTSGLHPHCTTTPAQGGAIYNGGTLTMSGTTFTGNAVANNNATCVVGEGGAIYNAATGSISSTNDTYKANAAAEGGAIYSESIASTTFTSDTFTGNTGCTASIGCPTSGCNATSCTNRAAGEGAAIFDEGVGVQVTHSSFIGNVTGGKTAGSVGEGGAIFLDSVFPSITHSTFTNNLAGGGTASCSTGVGGAIYATHAFEIDNDTFTGNAATGDEIGGGGAVVAAAGVTGIGDVFNGNKAAGTGGPCTTSAGALGGAVYGGGPATFTSSSFSSNSAVGASTAAAGAIGGTTVTLNGCAFTSNAATATGTGGATSATAEGGAVVAGSSGAITDSTFTSNSATAESSVATNAFGGALVAGGSSAFTSSGNTFTSNTAKLTGGTGTAAGGASVVATSSVPVKSNNETYSKNVVSSAGGTAIGGALYAIGGATMFNATFTSNSASGATAEAGALGVGGTGSTLFHLVMTANTATGSTIGAGGAILDGAGSTIYDSTISGNSASTAGGAILGESNPETIAFSNIRGNVVPKANAPLGGGGIANASGLTLLGVTVSGNSVTVSGAGPAGGGGIFNADSVTVEESTISGNKVLGSATQGGGGGMFSKSTMTVTNSTISNNSSSLTGGGVANSSSSSGTFTNVTLFKNAATQQGGNLYNASTSFTLNQSVVGGGTGSAGPDIDNPGTITSGGYNIVQTAAAGTAIAPATGDLTADPKLLTLTDNGGPTYTNADQSTSPGRGHIPYSGGMCGSVTMAADQRGFTRGHGGVCDSGAYEYYGVVSASRHRPMPPKPALRRTSTGKTPVPLPQLKLVKVDLRF